MLMVDTMMHLTPGDTEAQPMFGGTKYLITNPELILAQGVYPVEHSEANGRYCVTIKWEPHLVTQQEYAEKFWKWLTTRGGVAFWQSQDLSSGGRTVQTPLFQEDGQRMPKPHWQYPDHPIRIVTDPREFLFIVSKQVEPLKIKKNGDLTRAAKLVFDRLPAHSFWEPGADDMADVFACQKLVPLDEHMTSPK